MPSESLFIALGFTLFGAMLAVVLTLLVVNRQLRRRASAESGSTDAPIEVTPTAAHAPPMPEATHRIASGEHPSPQVAAVHVEPAAAVADEPSTAGASPGGAQDAIDPELFPIFEEEAAELLKRLGTDLARWARRPDDTSSRGSMLGGLQMLKGSARVAGAMQLGDRAQRLESEIEAIGRRPIVPADHERLQARFDTLQATFDGLRTVPGAPVAKQPVPDAVAATTVAAASAKPIAAAAPPAAKTAPASTFTLPLTTAVAQVLMLRAGEASIGVSSKLVELVQYVDAEEIERSYRRHVHVFRGEDIPFYWAGSLLQASAPGARVGNSHTVVVLHSARQRVALHVDDVLGNQELLIENLGPQLSRLPGMGGISVLASGKAALICNPAALAPESARAIEKPAKAPALAAVAAERAAIAASPPEAGGEQMPLILVVDDSITVRLVAQRLLQREGYRVALAVDGLQALSRLQEERPSVVLSDIEMPGMDGFDLARNIRADGALAGLPIIMITSRIAEKHREQARRLGVNHYLGKPYAEEELIKLVRLYTGADVATA